MLVESTLQIFVWATLLLLGPGDPEWLVVLRNGHEQRASAVEESGETVRLHFETGMMQIAATDIASVQPLGNPDPVTGLIVDSPKELRFELDEQPFRARVPAGFERSDASEQFVRLEQPNTFRVVRLLRDESTKQITPATLWQNLSGIRVHHAKNYDDYHLIRERFSLSGDQRSWLLLFTYRRGESTWKECRGFFIIESQVVVVTAATPAADQDFDPQQTVQSIGASLARP